MTLLKAGLTEVYELGDGRIELRATNWRWSPGTELVAKQRDVLDLAKSRGFVKLEDIAEWEEDRARGRPEPLRTTAAIGRVLIEEPARLVDPAPAAEAHGSTGG